MSCLIQSMSNLGLSAYDKKHYAKYLTNEKIVKFMKWRRLVLMFIIVPFLVGDIIWLIVNAFQADYDSTDYMSARIYDYFINVYKIVAASFTLCLSLMALTFHNNWTKSKNLLVGAFFIPYTLTFILMFPPISYVVKNDIEKISEEISEYISISIYEYIKIVLTYVISIYQIWTVVSLLAPASLSIIPAIVRGANIVKQIATAREMEIINDYIPMILLPLISLFGIIIIQITQSCLMMGAIFALNLTIYSRRWWRKFYGSIFLTLVLLYLFLDINDGFPMIKQKIKENIITWSSFKFVIEFVIKYNILTIIMADYLLYFLAECYSNARENATVELNAILNKFVERNESINFAAYDLKKEETFDSNYEDYDRFIGES